MKVDNIDVNKTIENAKKLLEEEKNISPALKAIIEILFVIITLFIDRLSRNSKNSSQPPSEDPVGKGKKKKPTGRKPGGQKGRVGKNLQPVADPDEIIVIPLDKRTLPRGRYHEVGYDTRQVVDIRISRHVIEYQAQILEDSQGNQFVAAFPDQVTRPVQYGNDLKAHCVYLLCIPRAFGH